jgi:hypothetical protein
MNSYSARQQILELDAVSPSKILFSKLGKSTLYCDKLCTILTDLKIPFLYTNSNLRETKWRVLNQDFATKSPTLVSKMAACLDQGYNVKVYLYHKKEITIMTIDEVKEFLKNALDL